MTAERWTRAASIAALTLFFIALLMSNAAQASTEAMRSDDGATAVPTALPFEARLPMLDGAPASESIAVEVPEARPLVLMLSGLIAIALLPESWRNGSASSPTRRDRPVRMHGA